MKKIMFLIAASVLTAATMSAQQKGDMYISGSVMLSGGNAKQEVTMSSTTNTTDIPLTFNLGIVPSFGYFVADNFEVNLALGYTLTKDYRRTDADNNKLYDNDNLFTIMPGVNYYLKLADRLYYVPGFSLGIGFGSRVSDIDVNTTENTPYTNFDLNLSLLTFEFRPADFLGVTFNAGDFSYSLTSTKESGDGVTTVRTVNDVDLGLNLGASIGLKYYF